MIAVIADDLTGAAELGGIGVRYGLRTAIRTAPGIDGERPELLIVAGDSRSKDEAGAVEEMMAITRWLRLLQPDWIYKKTDSIMRGHVIAELKTHLQILHLPLALLVPANPSLGRTIRDGRYFFNGQPVHLSAFATDPEFPVISSEVQDMLRTRQRPVYIRKAADELPVRGIVVGEVNDKGDLQEWARRMPREAMPAGGAEFFTAVLERRLDGRKPATSPKTFTPVAPILFVSGSTFDSSRALIREQFDRGGPVSYMPDRAGMPDKADAASMPDKADTLNPAGSPVLPDKDWAATVTGLLRREGRAIMAIDAGHQGHNARQLRGIMADTVSAVLRSSMPAELIIEGGSTAYAILEKEGWQSLLPEQELAPGTIRMRVPARPGLFITVKPGSYRWPESIRY